MLTTFVIYEFCVFELDWHVLFFIPNYHFARNALLQRPNGETRNILPTIIEIMVELESWRKAARLIYKEESIIQKNRAERSIA